MRDRQIKLPKKKDKKLRGGAAGETNVLSAINLNFSVQFIAIQ